MKTNRSVNRDAIGPLTNWKGAPLACAVMVMLLLPFLGKPVNIDETTYIWIARQILKTPLQPFAFQANWFGFQQPMIHISQSPPLVSYYLAAVGGLWGWQEITLHLAFVLPAVMMTLGIYRLAAMLCPNPRLATLLAVVSPAVAVSATSLMLDVPMMAFYVWSIVFWLTPQDANPQRFRALAGFMMCLGVMTKYFAITVVPLLAVYTLMARRRNWPLELLWLCLPVGVLGAFEYANIVIYGSHHFTNAAAFLGVRGAATFHVAGKLFTGMVFLGGCLPHLLLLVPLLWSKRTAMIWGMLIPLVTACFLLAGHITGTTLFDIYGSQPWAALFSAILFVGGIHLVALAAAEIHGDRAPEAVMLVLWVTGTVVFSLFVNWSINIRTLVPAVPPLAILVVRRMDGRGYPHAVGFRPLLPVCAVLAVAVTLSVGYADAAEALSQKRAAERIVRRYTAPTQTLWFQGHWGFQYYMEQLGAEPFDFHRPAVRAGEVVIMPLNNCNVRYLPVPPYRVVSRLKVARTGWVSTNEASGKINYHMGEIGGLPYFFWAVPMDTYLVYRLEPGRHAGSG